MKVPVQDFGTIDIAITLYNSAAFVDDCLKSVINQDYKNWKMIIVDDGSTDKTVDIVRMFIKDHKIKSKCKLYAIKPNCGYGMSLKTAIEYGDSEYVCILDSDDALGSHNALSIMVSEHVKHPEVSLIYSNYFECNADLGSRNLVKCRAPRKGETYLGAFNGNTYLGSHLKISHLKTFKRSYYNKTEGLNNRLVKAVDKDLILKLEEVGSVLWVDANLYLHRNYGGGISSSFKKKSDFEKRAIMEMKTKMYMDARDRRRRK